MSKSTKKSSWLSVLKPGIRSLGIEMTDTKIKAVETNHSYTGRISVEHYAEIALPQGSIEDGKIVDHDSVLTTLNTLLNRLAGADRKHVHFALPSSLTMVRFIKLPDVNGKDLKRMIEFELMYNIPLPFDNPFYDYIKISSHPAAVQPKGKLRLSVSAKTKADSAANLGNQEIAAAIEAGKQEQGATCDMMIAAAPLEAIQDFAGLLESAGLQVLSIEVKPLSLYRAIERLRPVDPMSAFVTVDITDTYTDVSVFLGGALRISRNIQVMFPSGNGDFNIPSLVEFEVANAVQELTSELERLIAFFHYSLKHREQEIDCVLVSGDTPYLKEIAERMQEQLTYRVDLFHTGHLKSKTGAFHHHAASYAVPFGLSLRGRQS